MTSPGQKRKLLPLEAAQALDVLYGVVRNEQTANNAATARAIAATESAAIQALQLADPNRIPYDTDAQREADAQPDGAKSYTIESRTYHTRENGAWVKKGQAVAAVTEIGAPLNLTTRDKPGIDPTGQTDSTAGLNALFASSAGQSVYVAAGTYLVTGEVTVPDGAIIYGEAPGLDDPRKGGSAGLRGSIFVMRATAQLRMGGGSKFTGATMLYDQQNYNIVPDATKPDGLSDFVEYPPTFYLVGTYNGADISNILYLGGSHIIGADRNANPEKTKVKGIMGAFTHSFFNMPYVTDIPQIDDCFFNPNSLYALIEAAGGSGTNWHTKVAKNGTLLNLGRVDELQVQGLFAFGIRTWAKWSNLGAPQDDGNGGGASFVNCYGDAVAIAFDIGRSNMHGFGIKLTNSWFTPVVKDAIEDGQALPLDVAPAMIRLRAGIHHVDVHLGNTRVYGSAVLPVSGSGTRKYDFTAAGFAPFVNIYLNGYGSLNAQKLHGDFFSGGHFGGLNSALVNFAHVIYNGVLFENLLLTEPEPLRGGIGGAAPANGSVISTFAARQGGHIQHGTGFIRAAKGPTAGGTIQYFVQDSAEASGWRLMAELYLPAGAKTGDPANSERFNSTFAKGELIRVVANVAGAEDVVWEAPIRPAY